MAWVNAFVIGPCTVLVEDGSSVALINQSMMIGDTQTVTGSYSDTITVTIEDDGSLSLTTDQSAPPATGTYTVTLSPALATPKATQLTDVVFGDSGQVASAQGVSDGGGSYATFSDYDPAAPDPLPLDPDGTTASYRGMTTTWEGV